MIGKRLSHYTILAEIGSGGMGVVYRARDEHLNCDVAIKVLPQDVLDSETARKRFRREALSLAKRSHANLVAVRDFDTQDGLDYLVMELVEGPTLSELLEGGSLPEEQVAALAPQLAKGLAAAHDAGVIHRDVKPGNIKVTSDGVLKILDFGLAKAPFSESGESSTKTITETGHIVGTVPYMAPELLRGKPATAQSDIYAAGIVLYEMTTGRRPHEATTRSSLIEEILTRIPPPPRRWNPKLSENLDSIIVKAIDPEPARRYQSAADLEVDFRRLGTQKDSKASPAPWLRIGVAALGVLAVLAAVYLSQARRGEGKTASLAVLPLRNLSTEETPAYFADGMTEELINTLAQIGGLHVISRTSVMAFRGDERPLKEIARQLDVRWILEGSVARGGSRVRISAQLLDASRDRSVWAQTYERELSDVLTLQSDVARAITSGVQVAIAPEEEQRMRRRVPVAPEAHEAYLRGLYRWNQREPEDIRVAIEEYTRAAQLDPRYAAPHAGLAEVYAFMGNFSLIPQAMAYGTARTEAKRALELDPELAEAHSALGVVNTEYEWNWESAEREYRRALALNPGSASTRQAYADFLSRQGRHDEALRTIQDAMRLDPLSPPVNGMLGTVYFHARRYEEAIAQYKRTLEMRREQVLTRFYLGLAYLQTGEHAEAISEFEAALRYSSGVPLARAGLACAYGMAGRTEEARKIFGQLKALSQTTNVSPSLFALISIGLGEKEQALDYLDQAYRAHDSYLGHLKVAPIVDSLRGERRFQEILRKLKLSDPSV